MKKFLFYFFTYLLLFLISFCTIFSFFAPIFKAEHLIFPYAIHPFDICEVYPQTWFFLKKLYFFCFFFSYNIIFFKIYSFIPYPLGKMPKHTHKKISSEKFSDISLKVGTTENGHSVYISEKGLFQNILITGTIGSGKTSSAMYPFTKQLIEYQSSNPLKKLALLVLDVKGNYADEVIKQASTNNREKDIILINLTGKTKYNPLDKPDLKPLVLANRLKTILTLFSKNNSESYWLDKAEQVLSEAIKFCRLYNDGYVTFLELHKLILYPKYFEEKVSITRSLFQQSAFNEEQIYDLMSCLDFFEKEFFSLDSRTLSILKSEISRITNLFVSDYHVANVFCPSKHEITFHGFEEILEKGKIVVLQMNIAEYRNLSKLIATYLKLDFQTAVMKQLKIKKDLRISAFISDEYQEYISDTDAEFYAESREAKCINILATQSYTSLLNSLKNESAVKVILQNLINKFWFRTDDIFTIEEAQKQIGKIEKEKTSITVSENARETDYNILTNSLMSRNSSISESYNTYSQNDYKFDTNYFSQTLKTFESLAFLSDGFSILPPQKIQMLPYFKL